MLPFGVLSFHEYCQVTVQLQYISGRLACMYEDEPASLLQLEIKIYMTYP
jgi:hypothetical protein